LDISKVGQYLKCSFLAIKVDPEQGNEPGQLQKNREWAIFYWVYSIFFGLPSSSM
jgi:hypothetical protein